MNADEEESLIKRLGEERLKELKLAERKRLESERERQDEHPNFVHKEGEALDSEKQRDEAISKDKEQKLRTTEEI
jgi:hypothetical protein